MNPQSVKIYIAALLIFGSNFVYAGEPKNKVKENLDKIMQILSESTADDNAKKVQAEKIRAVCDNVFDYYQLSRRSLGKNWKKLNADQQKEFLGLFTDLLANTYMDRIQSYGGNEVVIGKEIMLSDKKAEVQTTVPYNNSDIPIFYRLYNSKGTWKIYDVNIEGISLVSNYRNQFDSLLKKGSAESLLAQLRKKTK